jgi:rhodanese-related sulfurtransferase
VARQLQARGFSAVALEGGFNAWKERFPVEEVMAA